MKVQMSFTPGKILIIQLRQLGDVLLTTPVIRALKERYPGTHISFLTEKNAYDILSGNPWLDEIITVDRKPPLWRQLQTIMDIRKRKYDLIVDLLANPRTAYITFFSGAGLTISFDIPYRGLLYDIRIRATGSYVAEHRLSLLKPLGIDGCDVTPYIHVPGKADDKMAAFLETAGVKKENFLVCLDSTHRRIVRKWTQEGFAALADLLKERFDATVVFLRGPGEKEEVERIMAMCAHSHIISPETNIKELAALISRADLLVGNCSFPRHIAASVGTPSLAILGATGEEWTHPASMHKTVKKGLPCQPCNKKRCSENLRCLTELSVDEVLTGIEGLLPYVEKLNKMRDPAAGQAG